ncbi:acyl-CoA dehydrogenase family protein [uncultured Sphingomonas sp.]|uniref:acyl-CoA dehydrogenase family protein n=1 Tax=uncultured Sphingomonas sp. TaxID=158754 RepID=UPI0025F2E3F3|nr:acyl-CoA dehydrogenase family protein [uncultured Sphingomonas sp.]
MDDLSDINALKTSFREVLDAEAGTDAALQHFDHAHGMSRPLWDTIVGLGWTALAVPEAHGGLGLGIDALVALYKEAGRVVAPLPLLSTMLATDAIARGAGAAQQADWLPMIAGGAVIAVDPPAPLHTPTLTIERTSDGWRLSGATRILDAADADSLLHLAVATDGTLYRLLLVADGAERQPLWDHGHTLSHIHYHDRPVPNDAVFPSSPELEEALAVHAALALAAEAVGGCEGLLPLTIEYLKTRQQFGKPIGSFQALKHRIADHRTRLEGDRLLLAAATALAVAGDSQAPSEASAAKALACANYAELARDAIQLHGGIGFTAEHACHLFLKRARLIETLFGDAPVHLARAVRALDLEIAA